ncbi:hypothetical protein NDU88_001909 [Pleurodeles waltl]|uniref:Uncharacterized protein n=1 Tax=Pleurodeles waltl TaxID=8319 RepID=A0AAV7W0A5_PLEWA|nr:hypothetical protein NDU88_001909 [Pleurodeles waltl]
MATSHDAAAIRAALHVLSEAGRRDLLRPGVLDQAWRGMQHAMSTATHGIAVAVSTCRSPAGGEEINLGGSGTLQVCPPGPKIVSGALREPETWQQQVGAG